MLKESETYRRRRRDDPERARNKWLEYEQRKRNLPVMEPDEYERACKEIAQCLEI